ncbi:hypothetical protein A2999_01735 [Candidatus Wolfebacteria bacterium RIFCSPLOWO2_01_FULL_38_11]|uniref:Uncharacterized protein n=2 Tax=Candidatus Wolfeibacteriota TaxID=1752735 RepID=A0A0G0FVQ2_9BACT|nr:MAG: hypothetical protein US36_C0005G0029 [Candidatus Wolfebacteria bacterium GW2011_GWC1_37_10]OGM90668.1 MAG: hypothetical protein A2999_01735 [Candidatus Wolfebacteria bacterium RIFCSPLOWO2_01_FULL_38_11]
MLIWVIPIIIIILIAVGAWWYLTKLKEPITPFPVFSPKIPQGAQINQGNAISDIEQNLNVLPSDNNSLIQELDQLGKDITNF